ncbi:ABC transporter ATP-binding protein [Candidatus Magnetomorum sp. HK-1]|nr:ABC transporter ATP-binding protein [Candidatus Magnetomorum sp. HK-1]
MQTKNIIKNIISDENIYTLKDIQHFYCNHKVLDIEKLTIPRGKRIGVAGPNGSGKSTLLKLLAFGESPTLGTIFLNGKPEYPFSSQVRFKVSLLPQSSYLLNRTVAENIAYGLELRKKSKNIYTRVMDALDNVGLNSQTFANRKNHELSGGEARRVALAARLILEPEVLILDEPTAGIDAESALRIQDAIIDTSNKLNTTLIISSHDHEWLSDICENQLFLFKGKQIGSEKKNIIFGPFEPVSPQRWQTIEDKKNRFYVPLPPSPDSIALIDPKDVHLFSEKPQDKTNQTIITCQITRLFVTSFSSHIFVSMRVGLRRLLARVSRDNFDLTPGQKVYAVYDIGVVKWHDGVC